MSALPVPENVVPGPGAGTLPARVDAEAGVPMLAYAQGEFFRAEEALRAARWRPWGQVSAVGTKLFIAGVGVRALVGWARWRRT
ncbi:MAG: hypothetical protein HY722_00400 [Planctomycetes bacterium]|nr:hypothetical protein [Planctomycetota bacterium]